MCQQTLKLLNPIKHNLLWIHRAIESVEAVEPLAAEMIEKALRKIFILARFQMSLTFSEVSVEMFNGKARTRKIRNEIQSLLKSIFVHFR